MAKVRSGNLPSYDEAKKMKSLTLCSHGCLTASSVVFSTTIFNMPYLLCSTRSNSPTHLCRIYWNSRPEIYCRLMRVSSSFWLPSTGQIAIFGSMTFFMTFYASAVQLSHRYLSQCSTESALNDHHHCHH